MKKNARHEVDLRRNVERTEQAHAEAKEQYQQAVRRLLEGAGQIYGVEEQPSCRSNHRACRYGPRVAALTYDHFQAIDWASRGPVSDESEDDLEWWGCLIKVPLDQVLLHPDRAEALALRGCWRRRRF